MSIQPGKENGKKKKLLIFPFQITTALESHSDSHGDWITDISKFDVEVQFLWITPHMTGNYEHETSKQPPWPKHRERYISLKNVDKDLSEKYDKAEKKDEKKKNTRAAKTQDATSQDATSQDATSQDATSQDATSQDATSQDATSQDATSQDATRQDATSHDATSKDDTSQAPTNGAGARRRATNEAA